MTVQSLSSPQAEGAATGATISMLAEFAGGTGVIDQGVGEVISGVPVEVALKRSTTYTLTVTNGDGAAATMQLQVPVIFRAQWALDGASGDWVLNPTGVGTAVYERGKLYLAGGDWEIYGLFGFPCTRGEAEHRFTDAGVVDGRFATLTVELRGISIGGNLAPHAMVTYGGQRYQTPLRATNFGIGINDTVRLIVTPADRKIRTYINGDLVFEASGVADPGPPKLGLVAAGCSTDPTELGEAFLWVDGVLIDAR